MARPTINDVATRAGVSKKTVSFVLNGRGGAGGDVRERVHAAVAELGYAPSPQARALATGQGALFLVLHNGREPDLLAAALRGAGFALEGRVQAVAAQQVDDPASLAAQLDLRRPQGALILPPLSDEPALAEACRAAGCDAVTIAPTVGPMAVSGNDRQAAADATGYLLALGHRRIGYVAGPADDRRSVMRELGYIDAMAEAGLDRGADIVAQGDLSFASGKVAARLLLEVSPCPTAILAGNAAMAAGVLHAAHQAGLAVPDALSVMAVGDVPHAAELWPPLTAMRLPLEAMAHAATLKLLLHGDAARIPAEYPAELLVRQSTGPARPQAASSLQSG